MPHEIGHLATGNPRCHLDDRHRSVRVSDQLRKRDPVTEAKHLDCAAGDALGEIELIAVGGRGVDMDPSDPEADPGRSQPVGKRQHLGLAVPRDHDPVHLRSLDKPLEDAFLLRRLRQRCMQMAVEVVGALDPENASLAARIGRLQDRWHSHRGQGSTTLDERAHRRERRLRHAVLGERASHHDLVPHPLRHHGPDRREAKSLRHGCDDGYGAICRHGQRAVDLMALRDLRDCVDVREINSLRDVGSLKPGRISIPVNRNDADALFARLQNRAALVAPGADEEDGLHCGADANPVASESGGGRRLVASGRSHSRCHDGRRPRSVAQ